MKESAWLMQYNLSLLQIVLGQSFVDAANSPATARGTEMARSGGIWHLHFAFCVKSEIAKQRKFGKGITSGMRQQLFERTP